MEALIAHREAFLTDYQDAAYAARYRRTIDAVRHREQAVGAAGLTETVARSLFKLMAYKDEYEVARLHADPAFLEKLKEKFDGDFTIKYYMAPPFLPLGKDARGRPRKRQFGNWMLPVFRVLSRMKRLRGTPFDPFGYGHDRRLERGLVDWFESLVGDHIDEITAQNADDWRRLFELPMQIRGYGPVKEEAVARARSQANDDLAKLTAA